MEGDTKLQVQFLGALLPWTLCPDQGSVVLTSGFPGSIHSDLDGSVVGGHLGRVGEHGDCERETLPWEIKAGVR